MTKGLAEDQVRRELREAGLFVYKPPDDARNWKPCDFMTWQQTDTLVELSWTADGLIRRASGVSGAFSRWVEVKMTHLHKLPSSDMRPSQLAGVAEAMRLGIPYWLLVRFSRYGWAGVELVALQQKGEAWVTEMTWDWPGWVHKGLLRDVVARMVA